MFRTFFGLGTMLINLNKKAWSEGLKTGNFMDNDKVIRATSKFSEEDKYIHLGQLVKFSWED